jgi:hypothetical protein
MNVYAVRMNVFAKVHGLDCLQKLVFRHQT